MSQIDLHSMFQQVIAPYTPPPPPPPPAPEPAATPTLDQSQIQVPTQPPESFDLGALPWAAASAGAAAAAAAEGVAKTPPLQENPAFKELSEADQQKLTSFLEKASEGLDPAAAEALNLELSQLLSDGKLTEVDNYGNNTLHYLGMFADENFELQPELRGQTTKAAVARELVHELANPAGSAEQGGEAPPAMSAVDQMRMAAGSALDTGARTHKAGRLGGSATLR